jgi:outer membrane protein OmpA-like peptidoglycan-associated protein
MLPGSGMGGKFEALGEGETPGSDPLDPTAVTVDYPIKVGEVHFNSGSAELTPGGARVAREAVERIRSMDVAKVQVVAFTDRVGDGRLQPGAFERASAVPRCDAGARRAAARYGRGHRQGRR